MPCSASREPGSPNVMPRGQRPRGAGADGHDERAVAQLAAAGQPHDVAAGDDLDRGVADQLGAEPARDLGELVALGVPEGERLGGGQRPVGEVLLGGDERRADAVAGQVLEGEERLQGGDTASEDDDVQR